MGVIVIGNSNPPFKVELTGQNASINATTIFTAASAGEYIVNVYHQCTSAGTEGFLESDIFWTDDVGSQSMTGTGSIQLNITGAFSSNSFPIRVASNAAVQYSTTLSEATGSPQYSLFITVTKIS